MGSNIRSRIFARLFGLIALGLLGLAALLGGSLQAQAGLPSTLPAGDPTGKIDKQVLIDTANGQKASFVIFLAEQANLTRAYSMKDQDARGWYVYNTLRDTAARTQAPIRAALAAASAPFQSYWAANMIVATGDRNLVEALAARPNVRSIDSNDATKWIDDPPSSSAPPSPANAPNTVEWNVQNVNAPQVWAQGYTGQGMVIGNQDTGMRWTQVAIKPKYRGWNGSTADHNYNWWDAIHTGGGACGPNSQQPCDDYGHGTHTTGTTVGDDGAGNQIGVAPGAKWIGCRNMDQGNGTPARYTECFQFMIAPTDLNGQNPNPALRPDVINNSWTCPASEGCTTGGELETIVNNTQAAGIFVEASAGNSGPGCSSVSDPPAIYSGAFSTGAIDSSNTLAGFSSRGPSLYYTPNLLKPNISAPGVNVRSSYYSSDTSYTTMSGTSMAGPHVVGVVALIWSARPSLVRDITGTKQLLQNTANPNVVVSPAQTCGGIPSSQIPNNSFGYGRVDALAAFNASASTPTPTPTGTPPTNTPTLTRTTMPTATPTPCSSGVIVNGNFGTCSFSPGWVIRDTNPTPTIVGTPPGPCCAQVGALSGSEPTGDSSFYQQITVPAGGGTLSYWWEGTTTDTITFDWQDAYITDVNHNILAVIMHNCENTGGWVNRTFNMAPYAGQTVDIEFLVHEDGFGDDTSMCVTDVTLLTACPTGTPPTATRTNTPTNTPLATATSTTVPIDLVPQFTLTGGFLCSGGYTANFTLSTINTFTTTVPVTTTMRFYGPNSTFMDISVPPFTGSYNYQYNCSNGPVPCPLYYPTVYTLTVDIFNQVVETDETNNTVSHVESIGPTVTPCPSWTSTVPPTLTWTSTPLATSPATGTRTSLPQTATSTVTSGPSGTPTNTPLTPIPTHTTGPPTFTGTPTRPLPTLTAPPSITAGIPTTTPTECVMQFVDVHTSDWFYDYVKWMYCNNIISGYNTVPPCGHSGESCFKPNNSATRAQISKIVVLGFHVPINIAGGPHFQDVGVASTFYEFIETLYNKGAVSGYPCGSGTYPCIPPLNLPYFRPDLLVTRGQLTKIVILGASIPINTTGGPHFEDVPEGSTFYSFIETLYNLGSIRGYLCGGPGEPCDPLSRPYFRPGNNVTRAQLSKIVYLSQPH